MPDTKDSVRKAEGFREKCQRVIFLSNKPAEKLFDVALIAAIIASLLVVMLESVVPLRERYGLLFYRLEWVFTILFTIEYGLRIYVAKNAFKYARSFYGIVDLLSILPTYLDLLFPGLHYLMTFRVLRVLRVFRVLKMVQFVGEANLLMKAINASSRKISIFLTAVITLVCILGSIMYLIEGRDPSTGFTSIPKSVYWAIVTMTTVGYGDISPQTALGQFFASIIMITGYGIIAVPTGIISAEMARVSHAVKQRLKCAGCGLEYHDAEARFCSQCGNSLKKPSSKK